MLRRRRRQPNRPPQLSRRPNTILSPDWRSTRPPGELIDPATGYLLDLVNGRIIDPRTGYLVHPMTGLLIDPATGAQLDPVTLAIVIPAGFGTDTPEYVPGVTRCAAQSSPWSTTRMTMPHTRSNPHDGPTQPVGEIVVPTEPGEAREIS